MKQNLKKFLLFSLIIISIFSYIAPQKIELLDGNAFGMDQKAVFTNTSAKISITNSKFSINNKSTLQQNELYSLRLDTITEYKGQEQTRKYDFGADKNFVYNDSNEAIYYTLKNTGWYVSQPSFIRKRIPGYVFWEKDENGKDNIKRLLVEKGDFIFIFNITKYVPCKGKFFECTDKTDKITIRFIVEEKIPIDVNTGNESTVFDWDLQSGAYAGNQKDYRLVKLGKNGDYKQFAIEFDYDATENIISRINSAFGLRFVAKEVNKKEKNEDEINKENKEQNEGNENDDNEEKNKGSAGSNLLIIIFLVISVVINLILGVFYFLARIKIKRAENNSANLVDP